MTEASIEKKNVADIWRNFSIFWWQFSYCILVVGIVFPKIRFYEVFCNTVKKRCSPQGHENDLRLFSGRTKL
jgi:hypothetical protein